MLIVFGRQSCLNRHIDKFVIIIAAKSVSFPISAHGVAVNIAVIVVVARSQSY